MRVGAVQMPVEGNGYWKVGQCLKVYENNMFKVSMVWQYGNSS